MASDPAEKELQAAQDAYLDRVTPYRCIYCDGPCMRVHFGMDGVTRYQCRKCHEVSGSFRYRDAIDELQGRKDGK